MLEQVRGALCTFVFCKPNQASRSDQFSKQAAIASGFVFGCGDRRDAPIDSILVFEYLARWISKRSADALQLRHGRVVASHILSGARSCP